MTPAEAAQILYDACPVPNLFVRSTTWATVTSLERGWWEAMATALLERIEAELQSQAPCPRCGAGLSWKCYGCVAEEWKRRWQMAEQELARRVAAEANTIPRCYDGCLAEEWKRRYQMAEREIIRLNGPRL